MTKSLKVLLVIAIVISIVQICALGFELLRIEEGAPRSSMSEAFAELVDLKWKVYWFSGLGSLFLGLVMRKWYCLAGNAVCIAGTYLMLLGNGEIFFSRGHEIHRFATSVITLAILLVLAVLIERASKTGTST